MAESSASVCPKYHRAVELIGRRWTGAIVNVLLQGRRRFNEIGTHIPDMSDRMLSERLRELESEHIVTRIVVPETPVRVEYELTEKGRALENVVAAIGEWAERWVSAEDVSASHDDDGSGTSSARRSRTDARVVHTGTARQQ